MALHKLWLILSSTMLLFTALYLSKEEVYARSEAMKISVDPQPLYNVDVDHSHTANATPSTTPSTTPTWHLPEYTPTWNTTQDITLFSAYYETRPQVHAPSVVVLGYAPRSKWEAPLHCQVTLPNGSSICLPKETIVVQQCHCNKYIHHTPYEPVYHICLLDTISELVPVSVRLSSKQDCSSATDNIKVYNFRPEKKRRFGVCLQSPVYGDLDNQSVANFIEMNRLLGAEIFTIYTFKSLDKLALLYEDMLDLVQWPSYIKRKNIAHYYGQIMILNDCIYRNMYRAEYLLFTDLDELIAPANASITWNTVIDTCDSQLGMHSVTSYVFNNVYYMHMDDRTPKYMEVCGRNVVMPKYLTSFKRMSCEFQFPRRAKIMVKPQEVFQLDTHSVCESVNGYIIVPPSLASLHHYRRGMTPDCKNRSYTLDEGMLAYREQFISRLNTTCL